MHTLFPDTKIKIVRATWIDVVASGVKEISEVLESKNFKFLRYALLKNGERDAEKLGTRASLRLSHRKVSEKLTFFDCL